MHLAVVLVLSVIQGVREVWNDLAITRVQGDDVIKCRNVLSSGFIWGPVGFGRDVDGFRGSLDCEDRFFPFCIVITSPYRFILDIPTVVVDFLRKRTEDV